MYCFSFSQPISPTESDSDEEEAAGISFEGKFYGSNGVFIDENLVQFAIHNIDKIFEEANNISRKGNKLDSAQSMSVGTFVKEKFRGFLASCGKSESEKQILEGLFNWRCIFEKSDNACTSLDDVSLFSWGEYLECPGEPFVPLKSGFCEVVKKLIEGLPSQAVRCNAEVTRVKWKDTNDSPGCLSVETCDRNVAHCDHIIVTCSLGAVIKVKHAKFRRTCKCKTYIFQGF